MLAGFAEYFSDSKAIRVLLDRWARNTRIALESLGNLAKNNVSLVSITENIDYSTAQGKLLTTMLAGFAEYFSDSLGNHIKKGVSQRAKEGKHLGGIPFGFESCWEGPKGERVLRCKPEHPGGIHLNRPAGYATLKRLLDDGESKAAGAAG